MILRSSDRFPQIAWNLGGVYDVAANTKTHCMTSDVNKISLLSVER